MPRYAQLVMGPAGSGKSTYCSTMVNHCATLRRNVRVINLDPAAEHFDYPVMADIRELIELDDAMQDDALHFGPNGGLIFCMEYFVQNLNWLEEELGEDEDDYILFDCPGQIELYTHIPVMKTLVETLANWDFRVCGVFLLDAQFMIEASKFVSGVMCALSAMVNLEIPHVNVITKLDLLNKRAKKELERYLEPDMASLLTEDLEKTNFSKKYNKLTNSIGNLIDDYSLVKFMPLDITDEVGLTDLITHIDNTIQYGEDLEHAREVPDEVDPDEGGPDPGFFE